MERLTRYAASGMRSTLFLTALGCLLVAGLAGAVFNPATAARFDAQPVAAPQNYVLQTQEPRKTAPATHAQDHLHFTPIEEGAVLELRDGRTSCRAATEDEARAMRRDPGERLRVIGDEALAPDSAEQARKGLKIILRGTQQLEQSPEAKAAFLRAAGVWESLIQNPITVVIDVDFGPTAFGKPFEEEAYGVTKFQRGISSGVYPTIRSALIQSAGSPQEAALYNSLPATELPTDLGAATSMTIHAPVMRALGLLNPTPNPDAEQAWGLPPSIAINSASDVDFDPSDGIKPKGLDFNAAVLHEMGHALGFFSGVGFLEGLDALPTPDVPDLFRFRPNITFETFPSAPRILSSGGEHVFFGGGSKLPLSTGRYDGTGGDGEQAGHWKDDLFTGHYIGIMDPTFLGGLRYEMTANDIEAFERIGYRMNPLPNPREAELKFDDGAINSLALRDGAIMVNRLTPPAYPATLRKLRILIPHGKGDPNPTGKPITLLIGASSGQSPAGAQFTRIETTVPSASADLFLEFPISNGPTINSGDFYVGYKAPSPHQGVGFAIDFSGSAENRSFHSINDGVSFGPLSEVYSGREVNFMIRAIVSIPGPTPTPTPVPTPTPAPGPDTVALTSGAPQDGYAATIDKPFETQYTIEVPGDASQLKIDLNANTDVDLYARFGSRVVVQNGLPVTDFKSISYNHSESITITRASVPALKAGVYYLMIVNYGPGPSTFKITATATSCAYSLSPASRSIEASGGGGGVDVTASYGCKWSATSNANWINLDVFRSGIGSGSVNYSVVANNSASSRAGALTIAGQTFTVTQAGNSSGGGPTEILSIDDGAPEGSLIDDDVRDDGHIHVNRLTPSRYPAKLQTVRIFFRKYDARPGPSGSQIRLIAFAGPSGTDRPPENPPLLLKQTVTIPAIADGGEFVDFPIADGPTISSGDLYVGFQMPNPSGGVGAWFDLTSTNHLRSFFSINNNAFYFGPIPPSQANVKSANLMVRAVVSVGGGADPQVVSVSAASYSENGLASEAIAAAFGSRLATTVQKAPGNPECPTCLPMELGGTKVMVKDGAGTERPAPLFFVSSGQVNYLIPAGTAPGAATVTVTSGDGTVSIGTAKIAAVAPGLFTANGDGQGAPAAAALRVKADGQQIYEPVAQLDPAQRRFVPRPLDLGEATDNVFLILYGTGLRNHRDLSAVRARIGGLETPVDYAGPQRGFAGLDQINVRLPRSLIGRGEIDLVMMVDGREANKVRINIK